jgi:hypothetical protein
MEQYADTLSVGSTVSLVEAGYFSIAMTAANVSIPE